jgi:protein involved in polysaccharide export with SLBB domain
MKPGQVWSSWKKLSCWHWPERWGLSHFGACAFAAFILCFQLAGCGQLVQQRAEADKDLFSSRQATPRNPDVAEKYQVGCPDVLEVDVAVQPALKIRREIGVDGRIDLGEYGKPRVDGHTQAEIAGLVAEQVGVVPRAVQVRVAEYRSQQLFLFGQAVGWQRSVPYVGQETIMDFLQRVGVTSQAEIRDVYVVRAHIAEAGRPEVYHVDLNAMLARHDQKTNLRLLPNDQVYVGETRQAQVEHMIPPWFRPLYEAIWNTQPK